MIMTPDDKLVMSSMTKVRNSLIRNFSYKLMDKKATNNFLKAASREPIEIEEKQRCTVLTFSVDAYAKCVLPVLKYWEGETNPILFETMTINPLSFSPGYDDTGKHVDTVIAFSVKGKKVTVSCFNTTQKIKIEGTGYNELTNNYLIKLFRSDIDRLGNDIDDYNKGVIASLSRKRKIVARPIRNVRSKSMTPLSCDFCVASFPNSGQLSVHKKRKHTDVVQRLSSRIPIIDDLSLMDLSSEEQSPVLALELEENSEPPHHHETKCDRCCKSLALGQSLSSQTCSNHNLELVECSGSNPEFQSHEDKDVSHVVDSDLFTCKNCQYKTTSQNELNIHTKLQHAHLDVKEQNSEPLKELHDNAKDVTSETIEIGNTEESNVETIVLEKAKTAVVEMNETEGLDKTKTVLLKCNCCEFETSSFSELTIHKQLHHKQLLVNLDTGSIISCTECDYTCIFKIQLRKHMKLNHSHETKHSCSICDFDCNSSSDIVDHYVIEHQEDPIESIAPETDNEKLVYLTKQTQSLSRDVKLLQKALKKSCNDLELLMKVGLSKIMDENNVKHEALNNIIKKVNGKVKIIGR